MSTSTTSRATPIRAMETSLNTQLSTVGAFFPDPTLRALYDLHISAGRSLADTPPEAYWFFERNEPTYAILSIPDTKPLLLRLVAVVQDAILDCMYPHMTVIPLFERDATLCHSLYGHNDISFDWETEPDGVRPPVFISIRNSGDPITLLDATNLDFTNTSTHPTLPVQILKRNDIIIIYLVVELNAPILASPNYTFIARRILLAHSSTDAEAGLSEKDVLEEED
ncbi:hypothetical protein FKP32DRAFT_1586583 [Trametes sanguinea]|nr:hypothetical protein FKP32DRAFT_1588067 [Trametes sanguinea]KAI9069831.1 hypothetical protein FKP32DRAFT_1586583 [Trametes sanguinea]